MLDNLIISGRNDKEHLKILRNVFHKICEYGFQLNESKCKYLQDSVNYLGHTITAQGTRTSEENVHPIQMPRLVDKKNPRIVRSGKFLS